MKNSLNKLSEFSSKQKCSDEEWPLGVECAWPTQLTVEQNVTVHTNLHAHISGKQDVAGNGFHVCLLEFLCPSQFKTNASLRDNAR